MKFNFTPLKFNIYQLYSYKSNFVSSKKNQHFHLFQVKPELLPGGPLFSTPKSFSPKATPPHNSPPSPKYRSESPHNLLSSPLSVSTGEEPRRRAPRALTGRYVKSGPGASPRTLAILRKKIEERLKLKELLGENSNLYFGALKQQKHMNKPKTVANRF